VRWRGRSAPGADENLSVRDFTLAQVERLRADVAARLERLA
jgi:hypothetical protein